MLFLHQNCIKHLKIRIGYFVNTYMNMINNIVICIISL